LFSIIFVSLFAVGAVNAADDVVDAISVSDIDESNAVSQDNNVEAVSIEVNDTNPVSLDNNVEAVSIEVNDSNAVSLDNEVEAVSADAADNSKIISADKEDETVGVNVIKEENIIKEDNNLIYDLSGLFNGTTIDLSGLLDNIKIFDLLNNSGIVFKNGTLDFASLLNGTGITFKDNILDISSLLKDTGISLKNGILDFASLLNGTGIFTPDSLNKLHIDLSGLLNGTGIQLNGPGIDFSSLLNGSGIILNGTGIDLSKFLGIFGVDYSHMDLSILLEEMGLRNANLTDLLDIFDINVKHIDLTGLLNGIKVDISTLLKSAGISLNAIDIDFSSLFKNIGIGSKIANIDLTNLLDAFRVNYANIDLSKLMDKIGLYKPIITNLLDMFDINLKHINLTGLLNGIKVDLTALLKGDGIRLIGTTDINLNKLINIPSISNLFDIIFNTKKQDSIISSDLTKHYTKTTTFKVTVKNGDTPLTKGKVTFTINNKEYVANIGSNGVASLSLKNLKPGKYLVYTEYGQTTVKNTIVVKKAIITKNVSKKYKKTGKFTVKILNSKGKVYAKQTVKIKFKGKTYKIKTNSKGIASFKIPKKLKIGKYTIKTSYAGLTVSNKITVKK
jgi:hypothetical protein